MQLLRNFTFYNRLHLSLHVVAAVTAADSKSIKDTDVKDISIRWHQRTRRRRAYSAWNMDSISRLLRLEYVDYSMAGVADTLWCLRLIREKQDTNDGINDSCREKNSKTGSFAIAPIYNIFYILLQKVLLTVYVIHAREL